MSTPELLRETLREVLYGPESAYGLFSENGGGLLRTVHAFSFPQVVTPVAVGRPTPAQFTMHLRQSLEFTVAQTVDPHALPGDFALEQAWDFQPLNQQQWRAELVNLARAGQNLYEALYSPLNAEQLRLAHGGVTHAAYHTGALRFHLLNLPQ